MRARLSTTKDNGGLFTLCFLPSRRCHSNALDAVARQRLEQEAGRLHVLSELAQQVGRPTRQRCDPYMNYARQIQVVTTLDSLFPHEALLVAGNSRELPLLGRSANSFGEQAMSSIDRTPLVLVRGSSMPIPLGLPGQPDGRPTRQADRGDETLLQFSYQCIGGVVVLCAAVAGLNDYQAVWMEHHDDLLAECEDGSIDAIQSKTSINAGVQWFCNDAGFIDAVRKHCVHHVRYGSRIRKHIIFSNIKPYVPAARAFDPKRLASSPMRVVDECNRCPAYGRMKEPYKAALSALSTAVGHEPKVVFNVMKKLGFQKGPPMEAFGDQVAILVGAIPACAKLPRDRLGQAGMNLYHRLHSASILNTSTLALQASQLAPDGRELAAIHAKKVTVQEAKQIILRHPGENFLYDNDGMLKLGRIKSQKDVLRRKMTAGGVGGQFTSVWLQAISAEKRLMEEVYRDAKTGLQKLTQLEAVMIVECQNAEVESASAPESDRGLNIYRRILERTSELSVGDPEQVFGERVETLRGMAGLLSGSCHFAWGKPLPDASEEVPSGV